MTTLEAYLEHVKILLPELTEIQIAEFIVAMNKLAIENMKNKALPINMCRYEPTQLFGDGGNDTRKNIRSWIAIGLGIRP